MKPYIIVIEGIDASGKSTIVKKLANILGGTFLKTPPKEFRKACKLQDQKRVVYSEKRFFLYLRSVEFVSSYILSSLRTEKLVIIDRWVWSSIAFHFAFNPCLRKKWNDSIDDLCSGLVKPDLALLVHLSDQEEWLKRLIARKTDVTEDCMLKRPFVPLKIFEYFQEYNSQFKIIDNSGAVEDSLKQIAVHLPQKFQLKLQP